MYGKNPPGRSRFWPPGKPLKNPPVAVCFYPDRAYLLEIYVSRPGIELSNSLLGHGRNGTERRLRFLPKACSGGISMRCWILDSRWSGWGVGTSNCSTHLTRISACEDGVDVRGSSRRLELVCTCLPTYCNSIPNSSDIQLLEPFT